HCKGEAVSEIVGAAKAMRRHAVPIRTRRRGLIDTCGTGGDRSGSFNVSTTAAFVVAAAGVPVAKHGNRSATSYCGSIDLLEQLGVNVMLEPEQIAACLDELGIGVLFARVVHPAMKYAAPVRSELGFRTIFNFLGPLTNPASPEYQLVGISDASRLDMFAQSLQLLGLRRAWVVSASDGLDEITLTGSTQVRQVSPDEIQSFDISPEEYGLSLCSPGDLKGGSLEENAAITRAILGGKERGPKRDVILLNAGAALTAAEKTSSIQEGIELAAHSIDSGKAAAVLDQLVQYSNP
ncbi:MAG: anthranilate phosphoribosyltransferase, partial [Candidatus Hinthialibacter sp.]